MTVVPMSSHINLSWSAGWIVGPAIAIFFSLFRKWAPQPPSNARYDKLQAKEPLPTGVIGAIMWGLGICLASSFFLLRWMNHTWAQVDGDSIRCLYPPNAIWCFFPGFAALAIPWPLTIWWLRLQGRTDEADEINRSSSGKTGFDSSVIMKWMSIGLVGPIFFFTLLAIPKHLSLTSSEARLVPYASVKPQVFRFDQARHAFLVDEVNLVHGKPTPGHDLFIDFPNGRLDANAEGDGGTSADEQVIRFLLDRTGLKPTELQSLGALPPAEEPSR